MTEAQDWWLMTANPVTGRSEYQRNVAVFSSREAAVAYIAASRLDQVERVDGFNLTFRNGSLLRWFNGYSVGDYHEPESSYGVWQVNPCLFDIQFHQAHCDIDHVRSLDVPIDPVFEEAEETR